MDSSATVALLDSNAARRVAFERLLAAAGCQVHLCAALGIESLAAVRELQPALVFIAFEEPLSRAIHHLEATAGAVPDAIVVAFADAADTNAFRRAIEAGARYLIDTPASENELRAVLGAIEPRPPAATRTTGSVVVVAGQKGGIGKTTVSVNLANSLSRDNRGSVLLVDLDPDFGDAGILLDLNTNYSTARAAREQAHLEFESFKRSLAVHESGAFLLGAPQSFAERLATSPEDLQALLSFASQAFDYVLVDTPCMLNETVIGALAVADVTLVTTTLEFASLRNTNFMLREMVAEGIDPGRAVLLANHIDPVASFSVGDAAEVLERESIWEIPYDRGMPRSTQLGRPLTAINPKSPASKSLRALAGRLGEDAARIDRRIAVRGTPFAPAEVRERLISLVRPRQPAPTFIFSAAKRSTTFHVAGCAIEKRLRTRTEAEANAVPSHLKPCRICLPSSAAAA